MELNQTAARQARAYLDAHTRTDWSYPTLPPPRDQSDEELSRAVALRKEHGIRLPDAIIWASADVHALLLVTRNTKDFGTDRPGIRVPYKL